MVKICDAIMGSGKTSATIAYINSHPEKRFLYVTPYLPEAKRIKDNCPSARFVEPSDDLPQYSFSKSLHALALIEDGRNIASTHQAMMYYTPETFRQLKEKDYCVIIDEEINVLQKDLDIAYNDVKIAERAGYIYESAPNEYRRTDLVYEGGKFSHMFRLMASRPLICVGENSQNSRKKHDKPWYWVFPPELFKCVDDIIVLTYMFKNSEMSSFLKIHGIDYTYIGVQKTPDGRYEFSDNLDYKPEYTRHLKDMIHIEASDKMNDVGKGRTALSIGWYKTHTGEVEQLQKNIYNFFRNRVKCAVADRMCGTYKDHWNKIRGKGYGNSKVMFTARSSNEFRDRTVLAYPVNIFANGDVVTYYAQRGAAFDNDQYALSIMIQWIWRSAIRDGKEIWLYLPSRRMRKLLTGWIEEVSSRDDV